jgi:malate dehydrogenase
MVEAIVKDEKRLLAASAYLRGEYGHQDLFLGVPVLLGRGGVERIVELPLTVEEKRELDKSAGAVREGLRLLDSFYKPGSAPAGPIGGAA